MEDGVPEDFPRTAADTTRLAWTPDGGYLANLRTARTLPPCFSQSSVLQDIFRVKTNEGYALMVLPSKKGRIVLNGSSITDLIFLQETVA
jgi:hypothetical protein